VRAAESPAILREVAALEGQIGRRIALRAVREPDPSFRGRISERPGYLLVEYRDDTAGYFWHYDIIEELLRHLSRGSRSVMLCEGEIGYSHDSSRRMGAVQAPE
jgi:hypothetical protein